MIINNAIDISNLRNINSGIIDNAYKGTSTGVTPVEEETGSFNDIFAAALDNLNTTNAYLSNAENEELKFAMGLTNNTHDLTIALEKANTALQYTIAVRDKFLEAYKEIMQIQI